MPEIASVLVFRPDHIGDMIVTTPLLRALRMGFPQVHLSVLSGFWSREVLDGNSDVDEVIPCDLPGLSRVRRARWGLALATLTWVRQRRFDLMVNTRTAGSTAFYSFMAGGGIRWGFDAPKSRWACNRTISLQTDRHVVDANLDLARAIGCPVPSSATLMLYPDAAADLGDDVLLRSVDTPFIIMHQGAGHRSKLWHSERWARVADWVAANGFLPVLSGSIDERAQFDRIRLHMTVRAVNIAGRCDLTTFSKVVARAHLVVSVDAARRGMVTGRYYRENYLNTWRAGSTSWLATWGRSGRIPPRTATGACGTYRRRPVRLLQPGRPARAGADNRKCGLARTRRTEAHICAGRFLIRRVGSMAGKHVTRQRPVRVDRARAPLFSAP